MEISIQMVTKGLLVHLLREKQTFETEFKAFIKDQSIPLDERWDLFKFACENNLFVNVESCGGDSKILDSHSNFTWYDWFRVDRGNTVIYTEIIEHLEYDLRKALDINYKYKQLDTCLLKSQEEIDELKEEFLNTGYSGFVYDW